MGSMVCVLSLKDVKGDFAFGTENDSLIWITFGISLFHIFFPMESLNKKLFPIKDELTETITYEDAQVNFTTVSKFEYFMLIGYSGLLLGKP